MLRPNISNDIMKAQQAQIKCHKGQQKVTFAPGESVLVRNYSERGPKQVDGKIVTNLLNSTCEIKLSLDQKCKRHIDQLIKKLPVHRSPRLKKKGGL